MQLSIIKQVRILKRDIKVTPDSDILGIILETFVKLNLSLYVITQIKNKHLCR
jgi:hypothetical protein